MEYIVLASSPGITTEGLLDLFNNPGSETLFVAFATSLDTELITVAAQTSVSCIVFHGEYHSELIKRIHTTYPITKNILVFDTAEAALLQKIACGDIQVSLDACIHHWIDCISQMTLFAEQNPTSTVLVDYVSLTDTTEQILTLVNARLGIQLNNGVITTTVYSSIARLIAAAALINHDETMVFYDDARTLALTIQHSSGYIDAASLVAKQHSAALNEFQVLLKHLQSDNAIKNIALAVEQQGETLANVHQQFCKKDSELAISLLQIQQLREELDITQLTATQLREEMDAMQANINTLRHELTVSASVRQQLNSKQSELEIALLQLNQLQEELEDTLEKYNVFERPLAGGVLMEKVLGELPFLGLLRNRVNTPTQTN